MQLRDQSLARIKAVSASVSQREVLHLLADVTGNRDSDASGTKTAAEKQLAARGEWFQ